MLAYDRASKSAKRDERSSVVVLTPFLQQVIETAQKQPNQYLITAILLANGRIADLPTAAAAIVEASQLPISLVILGIGDKTSLKNAENLSNEDFVLMSSGEKTMARNIVHFVNCTEIMKNIAANENTRDHLRRNMLAKVPEQFASYLSQIARNNSNPDSPPSILNYSGRTEPDFDTGSLDISFANRLFNKSF